MQTQAGVALAALAAATGCMPTVQHLGFDARGRAHGAAIMEAVAVHLLREGARDAFGPYQDRLTAQVLTPSLLWSDPGMWTERTAAGRTPSKPRASPSTAT